MGLSVRPEPATERTAYLSENSRRFEYLRQNLNICAPWYDAGMGVSLTRDMLSAHFDRCPITTDLNLNNHLLPYRDSRFQTITHLEVVEHLLNPLFALSEAARILKPGGVMYLTTPNDYSLIYKLEHLLSRKYGPHFHQFSERDLRWLLGAAGFEITRLETFRRSWKGKIARFCNNSFFVEATKRKNGPS